MRLIKSPISPEHSMCDLDSVLASAKVATIEELSQVVHQNEDVDTWVVGTHNGVVVCTPLAGTELTFPFTWQDFWSVAQALEQDFLARRSTAEAEYRDP